MKKCVSFLLAVALMLSIMPALPITVHADQAEGIFQYGVKDGEATINGCNMSSATAVVVPATLGGYPVTSISYMACNMTSVTIPKSVTNIRHSAFSYCKNLTGIWVDENNPAYCNDRKGVLYDKEMSTLIKAPCAISGTYTIPDSVVNIGPCAFEGCTQLTNIVGLKNVSEIGNSAFSGCVNLESIIIPNGVADIGNSAFEECVKLQSIVIPDSVSYLGAYAFLGCTGLTFVNIGTGIIFLPYHGFSGCSRLQTVTIAGELRLSQSEAFTGCTALKDVWYSGSKLPSFRNENDPLLSATWHFNYCGEANHTHDNDCDADCNTCGYPREVPDHVYDFACDSQCNICGASRFIRHTYTNDCDTICNVCTHERTIKHTFTDNHDTSCNVCGHKREMIHEYSSECDTKCNVCNFTRSVSSLHTYDYDCDKTCNKCEEVRDAAHIYDNENDLSCNLCKESLCPPAPKLESCTPDSITLVDIEGLEYCMNYGEWQSSNIFTGLSPESRYYFYQRVAESETSKAGPASKSGEITTQTREVNATKTDTTITVYIDYDMSSFDFSIDGINWVSVGLWSTDDSITFYDLTPGTTYTVYQKRYDYPANTLEITTYRHTGSVVFDANGGEDAPTAQTKVEQTPLTLSVDRPIRAGYSFAGWALTPHGEIVYKPGDEYTQDASLTLYAIWGAICSSCDCDGKAEYECSSCNGRGYFSSTSKVCPYCGLSNFTFYQTGVGISLYQCNVYSCRQTFGSPKTETDTYDCSSCSSGWLSDDCATCHANGWLVRHHDTAPAPELESKTISSITLVQVVDMEYSMDGITWQDSNVFENLKGNTQYSFYQRYKETSTLSPAEPGEALTVVTDKPPYTPGDVNADEKINSLDGLLLLRYLNGWDITIVSEEAMDVNADGKVNSLDGLILMRYLNGWDVTLG